MPTYRYSISADRNCYIIVLFKKKVNKILKMVFTLVLTIYMKTLLEQRLVIQLIYVKLKQLFFGRNIWYSFNTMLFVTAQTA